MEVKRCTRCKQSLPVTEFSFHRYRADGSKAWQAWCKPCHAAYARTVREMDGTERDALQLRAYNLAQRRLRERHRSEFNRLYEQAKREHGYVEAVA